MERITTTAGLREAIVRLESRQAEEGIELREHLHVVYNSLKPINLIKSLFIETVGSEDIKENVISNSLGLTAGYISKLLFEGVMKSPLNKMIGTAIMLGINSLIAKNPEIIRSMGKGVLNFIRSRSDAKRHESDHSTSDEDET